MSDLTDRAVRARRLGEQRFAERCRIAEQMTEDLEESEADFERIVAASEAPGLWEQLTSWLADLALSADLLRLERGTVRGGELGVGADPSVVPAVAGVQVQIAFENHHTEQVWVVTCEQDEEGILSFTPEQDLATSPRVAPGDALTFSFTPTTATTLQVLALAFQKQPQGTPEELLSSPDRLKESMPIASARFTLRVLPAQAKSP
jgi:hypothetical protein